MSKVVIVRCDACGADLPVVESSRLVNCRVCHTPLEIVNRPAQLYARALRPGNGPHVVAGTGPNIRRLQRKLRDMDQTWQTARARMLVRLGREGTPVEPNSRQTLVGGIVALAGGVAFCLPRSWNPIGAPHVVIGTLVIGMGLVQIIVMRVKAHAYEKAMAAHRKERDEVMGQIRKEQRLAKRL